MLRVNIEILGKKDWIRQIGEIQILNVESLGDNWANYKVRARIHRTEYKGKVESFSQGQGALKLIEEAIRNLPNH